MTKMATSGIEFLANSPYPTFAQHILELEPSIAVLHTLRDAQSWTDSRFAGHTSFQALCKSPLLAEPGALPPGSYLDTGVESCGELQDWKSVTAMFLRYDDRDHLLESNTRQ